MAKNKLYWKKEKKREKKEKNKSGRGNKRKTKIKGECPLILYTVNPSTALELSSAAWSITLFPPVLLAVLHLGEGPAGPAVLILRCVHLVEMPSPLPGALLHGSCLSCEAPAQSGVKGDTSRNNSGSGQLSSPRVKSRSNTGSSQSTGTWMLPGQGHQSVQLGAAAGASLLSCVLPASACPGGCRILGCVPRALGSGVLTVGIQLLGSQPPPCIAAT